MDSPANHDNLYLAYQLSPETEQELAEWSRVLAEEPPLPPMSWHLRRDAYLRHAAIGASIRIEGNTLSDEQTDAILQGNSLNAPVAQALEAQNYDAALGLAHNFAHDAAFEWTELVFRMINGAVMRDLEDDTHGRYRTGPVGVGNYYEAPDALGVPGLMATLVHWLRTTDAHPLVRTALLHLNLVAIHPWSNGNGRSARILSQLELMRTVEAPELISVEPDIESQQDTYYARIRDAVGPRYTPERHSATEWVAWYVHLHACRLAFGQRLNHATMHDIVTVLSALERRGEPVEWGPVIHMAAFGPITTREIQGACNNCSPSAARALAGRLASAGWIEAHGQTKGRHYAGTDRVRTLQLRGPELVRRSVDGLAAQQTLGLS